ncbi:hypothetical protein ACGFX8_31655 [Streptomyces sp. NPDC048362]
MAGPAGATTTRRAFGVSDQEYNQYLDDTFGPSPEARAKAAGQQGSEG